MSGGEIIVLSLVFLCLLGGLVALGLGHRRWSWGTVVAAILVLLSAGCYVYLAARLAAREVAWRSRRDRYEADLARVRDALRASRTQGLEPIDGEQSIADLRASRDLWKRGRDRVETWNLRSWKQASFTPPENDTATGTLTLAADGNAKERSPLGEGARVFLFDDAKYEDGGRYIGEFIVTAAAYDDVSKRHVFKVAQTAPRDPYDVKMLSRPHESVTVFESLPVDRWLAFFKSQAPGEEEGRSHPTTSKDEDSSVVKALGDSAEVSRLVKEFVESFELHDSAVLEEEWPQAARRLQPGPNGEPPEAPHGTYWAEVEFDANHAFAPAAGAPQDREVREYLAGDRAEFDLQTAIDLRDSKKATIKRVVYRRRLTDATTMLSGADIGGQPNAAGIRADGLATLMRLLRAELARLERSYAQLEEAEKTATARSAETRKASLELKQDLESWERDVVAATKLHEDFSRQLEGTRAQLADAENRIAELGRELRELVDRLTAEVDRVAPKAGAARSVSIGGSQP